MELFSYTEKNGRAKHLPATRSDAHHIDQYVKLEGHIVGIYNVYIKKRSYDGYEFGNRYLLEADSLEAAGSGATLILEQEQLMHYDNVTFLYVRTSDTQPLTDVFETLPLSFTGLRTSTSNRLPSILTVNAKIGVTGGGRPSRKFYHLGSSENDQDAGQWNTATRDLVTTALYQMISDVQTTGSLLVDPDGQPWLAVAVQAQVGTHQWSKRSRRRPA